MGRFFSRALNKQHRGFSLLEVLVASFLALTLAVAFSSALSAQLRAINKGRNHLAAQYLLNKCLTQATQVDEDKIDDLPIIQATRLGTGTVYTITDRIQGKDIQRDYTMSLDYYVNDNKYIFTAQVEWTSGTSSDSIESTYVRIKS